MQRADRARSRNRPDCTPRPAGDGSALCSGDMLLEALVACAGVTLRAVATALSVSTTSWAGYSGLIAGRCSLVRRRCDSA